MVNAIQKGDIMKKVRIEGSTSEVIGKMKEPVAQWNSVLDKKFPKKD